MGEALQRLRSLGQAGLEPEADPGGLRRLQVVGDQDVHGAEPGHVEAQLEPAVVVGESAVLLDVKE